MVMQHVVGLKVCMESLPNHFPKSSSFGWGLTLMTKRCVASWVPRPELEEPAAVRPAAQQRVVWCRTPNEIRDGWR